MTEKNKYLLRENTLTIEGHTLTQSDLVLILDYMQNMNIKSVTIYTEQHVEEPGQI